MKFEQSEVKAFQPVTITLENIEEIAFFASLLGSTNDDDELHVCKKLIHTYNMYDKLDTVCNEYGFERGRLTTEPV